VTQIRSAVADRRAKRRTVVIASSAFTIAAGATGTVKLKLSKLGRRLFRSRTHGLAVTVRVIEHGKTVVTRRAKLRAARRR
jgi:hypothetical protein